MLIRDTNTGATLKESRATPRRASNLQRLYSSAPLLLSTHSIAYNLIVLVLSNCFRAPETPFPFVSASAGLVFPVIYFTSVISLRSYNCLKQSTSIIRRFSCVVPSLTRHSYSDFESVQSISGRLILRTSLVVALRAPAILKPSTITYNSEASTLLVTLLHLTEVQYSIFARLSLESIIIVPICDERSLLFANKALVKTSSLSLLLSSGTNFRPLAGFSICH